MSLTALAWIMTVVALFGLAWWRPAYGFSLYVLTFFMFPSFWWWGDELPALRWNLFAGIVLLATTAWHHLTSRDTIHVPASVRLLAVAIAANATFVHFVFAPSAAVSADSYTLLLKFTLLLILMTVCIRDRADFRIVLWSVMLGAAYIGYEVTVNDRGSFSGGRLEDIGAAGVQNANELASLMATILPLAVAPFLVGRALEKIAAVIVAPLILNVLLLCNSRGAFLACIAGAMVFLATAGGPARKKATKAMVLGAVAIFLLLKDPDIVNRFMTVFVSGEERDNSAASRLIFWRAGLRMIADHPLGAGGDGFARAYGARYLGAAGPGPVHNGFITEATEWGLQGLLLRMLLLGTALAIGWRTMRERKRAGDGDAVIMGACLLTSMATYLGSSVFGDYISDEWGYWAVALLVVYGRLYTAEAPALAGTAPAADVEPFSIGARPALDAQRRFGFGAAGQTREGAR